MLSVWYPSCHDHDTLIYFDPQERIRKLARERLDQRSRRRKGKMRAREQPKQSAGLHQKHLKLLKSCWLWSKSLEGTNVHLELENSCKAKNLSAPWIIFPIEVLNSAHLIESYWTNPNSWIWQAQRNKTPGLNGRNPGWLADSRSKFQAPKSSQVSCPAALRWRGPLPPLFPP